MASETARTISTDEEKDLPAKFQRRASKLVYSLFVSDLCHGSGLSIRITDTQCLKKAEFIIFPSSFKEFRMEIPLQLQIKQSAAPVKYNINHNTSIFSNEANHKPYQTIKGTLCLEKAYHLCPAANSNTNTTFHVDVTVVQMKMTLLKVTFVTFKCIA